MSPTNCDDNNCLNQSSSSFSDQSPVDYDDNNLEIIQLSALRCSSLRSEVINEQAKRRRSRSSGYPGLAFGSFSSGAFMKFSIISNDLHNIKNVQLKRVGLNNNNKINEAHFLPIAYY